MKLDDFLRLSVIPQIQVTSLYFKPNIPQEKLVNAIREYAPDVGMSTAIALLDETFWGNAKEGMIVTNEKIILSKKFGGRVIPLASVNQIEIKDKNLIVNDLPLARACSELSHSGKIQAPWKTANLTHPMSATKNGRSSRRT